MDIKYITKTALAQANGVSAAYISKLVKKGVFNSCLEDGKLLRDLALQTYLEIKDPTRDSQREANRNMKISPREKNKKEKIAKAEAAEEINSDLDELENNIPKRSKKDILANNLYNNENLDELDGLLSTASTSSQKVQIIKDFWTGKINEQKFLEGEKLLMPKEEIIKDVQRILKAFRDKTLSLPTKMSSELVGIKDKKEVAAIVESYCYELLDELSSLEDIE